MVAIPSASRAVAGYNHDVADDFLSLRPGIYAPGSYAPGSGNATFRNLTYRARTPGSDFA